MNSARRHEWPTALTALLVAAWGCVACGGSSGSGQSPMSGEAISCGALEYISDGQCVPLVVHGPWDAAAFVQSNDAGDASPGAADADAATLLDASDGGDASDDRDDGSAADAADDADGDN